MHWSKKAISQIQSYGTLLSYALSKMSVSKHEYDEMNGDLKDFSKKRLVVCIHGLNNNPTQFKKIIEELLQKDLSETDIFVPSVLQKGNAKLDEMVKPIFEKIEKWENTPGEKELVLVGISNGSRIARAIETEITKSDSYLNIKKLRFISIVGACKGSTLVNFTNKAGLSWLMSKNISEEMPTTSKRNQQLNEEWTKGLSKQLNREYTFIASPHDWLVTNYNSSLMEVNVKDTRYAIITGHGHNSIVNAVSKLIPELILN